ncbi:MAG: hypothetical protein ABI758_03230 [Candidatus Woesebacteria bacterium]
MYDRPMNIALAIRPILSPLNAQELFIPVYEEEVEADIFPIAMFGLRSLESSKDFPEITSRYEKNDNPETNAMFPYFLVVTRVLASVNQ